MRRPYHGRPTSAPFMEHTSCLRQMETFAHVETCHDFNTPNL